MSDSAAISPVESFVAAASEHWQQRGSRRTHVREVICRVVAERTHLFTAEQLLPLARAVDRGISLASIYRTLGDLTEFGLLHESRGAQDERCYAVLDPENASAVPSAATVVCRDCGDLHPLETHCLAMRESFAIRQAGFTPRKLDLRIEADCESLRATGHCDRGRAQAQPESSARADSP